MAGLMKSASLHRILDIARGMPANDVPVRLKLAGKIRRDWRLLPGQLAPIVTGVCPNLLC